MHTVRMLLYYFLLHFFPAKKLLNDNPLYSHLRIDPNFNISCRLTAFVICLGNSDKHRAWKSVTNQCIYMCVKIPLG